MKSTATNLSSEVKVVIARIKLEGSISGRKLIVEKALAIGQISEEEADNLNDSLDKLREDWGALFGSFAPTEPTSATRLTTSYVRDHKQLLLDEVAAFARSAVVVKKVDDDSWPSLEVRED